MSATTPSPAPEGALIVSPRPSSLSCLRLRAERPAWRELHLLPVARPGRRLARRPGCSFLSSLGSPEYSWLTLADEDVLLGFALDIAVGLLAPLEYLLLLQ